MEAAIQPLIKDSSWWANAAFSLYEGEVAWEVAERDGQGIPTTVYMLRGDGLPVNPNYQRLRVRADNLILEYLSQEGTVTKTIKDAFTQMVADQEALEYGLATEEYARQQADAVLDGKIDDNTQAIAEEAQARQQADAVLDGKIDDNTQAIAEEAQARAQADAALDGKIDDNTQAIAEEAQARQQADTALDGKIDDVDAALQERIDEADERLDSHDQTLSDHENRIEEVEQNKADKEALADFEAEVRGDYAPLDSPHFTSVPTVPSPAAVNYSEPMQALPVEDYLELFDLTMDTTGALLREVDMSTVTATGGPAWKSYERCLDKVNGNKDEYREIDAVPRKYATEKQFWDLYYFVLSTLTTSLRLLDTVRTGEDFGFDFRMVDVADGAKPEIREMDEIGSDPGPDTHDYLALADCIWTDGVHTARAGNLEDALDYLRLSMCEWKESSAADNEEKEKGGKTRLEIMEEKITQMESLLKKLSEGVE